jgi:hypothetical protein
MYLHSEHELTSHSLGSVIHEPTFPWHKLHLSPCVGVCILVCKRPWRSIGLRDVKDPALSRPVVPKLFQLAAHLQV